MAKDKQTGIDWWPLPLSDAARALVVAEHATDKLTPGFYSVAVRGFPAELKAAGLWCDELKRGHGRNLELRGTGQLAGYFEFKTLPTGRVRIDFTIWGDGWDFERLRARATLADCLALEPVAVAMFESEVEHGQVIRRR